MKKTMVVLFFAFGSSITLAMDNSPKLDDSAEHGEAKKNSIVAPPENKIYIELQENYAVFEKKLSAIENICFEFAWPMLLEQAKAKRNKEGEEGASWRSLLPDEETLGRVLFDHIVEKKIIVGKDGLQLNLSSPR